MSTTVHLELLSRVRIASPCPVRWEDMTGDDKTRRCAHCNLNVHNLSAMTHDEAEALLAGQGNGRLCAGYFRRADGTILTRDCPVGLAAARARARRIAGRVVAALGVALAAGLNASADTLDTILPRPKTLPRLRTVDPFSRLCAWLAPAAPTPPSTISATFPPLGGWTGGDIAPR